MASCSVRSLQFAGVLQLYLQYSVALLLGADRSHDVECGITVRACPLFDK